MFPGVSALMLTEISSKLYTEYITSTLEIVEKLDLTTLKQEEIEAVSKCPFKEKLEMMMKCSSVDIQNAFI